MNKRLKKSLGAGLALVVGDVAIQGYYFSRPLPMPDYEKLLDKYPLRPH